MSDALDHVISDAERHEHGITKADMEDARAAEAWVDEMIRYRAERKAKP